MQVLPTGSRLALGAFMPESGAAAQLFRTIVASFNGRRDALHTLKPEGITEQQPQHLLATPTRAVGRHADVNVGAGLVVVRPHRNDLAATLYRDRRRVLHSECRILNTVIQPAQQRSLFSDQRGDDDGADATHVFS